MNEHSAKKNPKISIWKSEAEGILWMMLFRQDLRMYNLSDKKLRELREDLAQSLRPTAAGLRFYLNLEISPRSQCINSSSF